MHYLTSSIGYLLLFFLLLSYGLVAQLPDCGYDQAFESLKASDPIFQQKNNAYEKAYQEYMHAEQKRVFQGDEFLHLPLVIHVIHSGQELGSTANPTNETILDAIAHANYVFRQEDVEQEFENPFYGVDTEISFCIAYKDDEGQPAPGILRYDKNLISSVNNPFYLENLFRDKDKFINIVILDTDEYCGVYYPQADVIYVSNKCLVQSETMAHELGHYLSLQHTFFQEGVCDNSNCLIQGDFVCDTPPQLNSEVLSHEEFGNQPCLHPGNSCQSDEDDTSDDNPYRSTSLGGLGDQPDANSNIMGYGGSCRNSFTIGQAQRMQFNLVEDREELWSTALACEEPNTTLNDVSVDKVQMNLYMECGQIGDIEFELLNDGSTDLKNVDIILFRNELLIDSINWQGLINENEKEVIRFENIEALFAENLFTVKVKNPNFNVDFNTGKNTSYLKYSLLGAEFEIVRSDDLLGCERDTVSIGVNFQDSDQKLNFVWRRANGLITDENRFGAILEVTESDVYYLNIYSEDYSCEWTEEFTINKYQPVKQDLVVSTSRKPYLDCFINSVILASYIDGSLNYSMEREWYSRSGFLSSEAFPNIDSAGDYRFRIADEECNSGFFSNWFTVYDLRNSPKAHLIVEEEITCENTSVFIDGTQSDYLPGRYSYRWTDLKAGKVLIENDTTLRILVTTPGIYSLEVIDKITRCSSTAEVEVKASSDMPIAKISLFPFSSDPVRLYAEGSSEGSSFSFEWSTIGGEILEDEVTLNPLVKARGTYNLEIVNNDTGCKQSAELSFLPKHIFTIFSNCNHEKGIAGKQLRIDFINPNLTSYGTYDFDLIWTLPDGSESTEDFVNTTSPGLFKVRYFNNVDTVRASIVLLPEMFKVPEVINISLLDSISCPNEVSLLSVGDSELGADDIITWRDSSGNTIGDVQSQEIIGEGVFSLEIFNPNSLCVDEVFIEITLEDHIVALAGQDKALTCDEEEINLGENVEQDDLIFSWSNLSVLDSIFVSSASSIAINEPGLYELELYNSENDCYSYDTVEVKDLKFDYNLQIQSEDIVEECEDLKANLFVKNIEDYYGYDIFWTLPSGDEESRLILPVDKTGNYTLHVNSLSTGCTYMEDFYYDNTSLQLDRITILESDLLAEPTGGNPPYTYLWNTGSNSEIVQSPIFKQQYAVTVTDASGCTALLETQYLQPPNNESVILMPNPASDNIQIFIQSGNPVEEIKIYNTLGVCVKTIQDYQSLNQIDISQLSSGVYVAVLSDKSQNYTAKFIKY